MNCFLRSPDVPNRPARVAILLAGLVLSQCFLYGPSLLGRKLLLPLDCLAARGWYLPPHLARGITPRNMLQSDAVLQTEPDRIFATREVRSGRLPLWNPYNYCGVPFLANNNSAVFSPFMLPSYLWPGPEVVAWAQLFKALVSGVGAYCFFRRVLGVGFWPAAFGGWCYPHTGYLVLWSWIHHSGVVCWLPWLLLATFAAVQRPGKWAGPFLAFVTALTLLSGKIDTSGQVLLASGLFAVWCMFDRYGARGLASRSGLLSMATTLGGWALGFSLAAPVVLPTYAYLQRSSRVETRRQGRVDFEGSGLTSLPQVVLPYLKGSHRSDSRYLAPGNRLESSAIAYAGLLATLVLAPLGWSRRFRSINGFWSLAGLFALSPLLAVPIVREIFTLPPLNLLQNNRFAFLSGWCLLAMAVAGLEVLRSGKFTWRRWHGVALVLIAFLGIWCCGRGVWLPVAIPLPAQPWFRQMYLCAAILCGVGALAWLFLRLKPRLSCGFGAVIAVLALAELLYNASGVIPQSDPSLYYPELPVLKRLAAAPPGRICGARSGGTSPPFCLPASLGRVHGLWDIRGYDGADPAPAIKLLEIANPFWDKAPHFAVTQSFQPVNSRILDMLNLRYRIFRGTPPEGATVWAAEKDYWVIQSESVLPRPFVPSHVEVVSDQATAARRMANRDFDPRAVALVEVPVDLPATEHRGSARIEEETPTKIRIDLDMETPGLVVLADLWYSGWHATLNDAPVTFLRTNGFLRGVVVPEGRGTLEFRYAPESYVRGLWVLLVGGAALLVWVVLASDLKRLFVKSVLRSAP